MKEWIKVSEKKPKANRKVLVVTSNGKYTMSEMYFDNLGNKVWSGSTILADSIVAWMPIPIYRENNK